MPYLLFRTQTCKPPRIAAALTAAAALAITAALTACTSASSTSSTLQASAAGTVAATAAVCTVTVLLTRKRVTWSACLDMPVGFTPGQSSRTGTRLAGTIEFGEHGLRDSGPDPSWPANPRPRWVPDPSCVLQPAAPGSPAIRRLSSCTAAEPQ
jgi:hypothetical protein